MFFQVNSDGDRANGIKSLREACAEVHLPVPQNYIPQTEDGYCFEFHVGTHGKPGVYVNHADRARRILGNNVPKIEFGDPPVWLRGEDAFSSRDARDAKTTVEVNQELFRQLYVAWNGPAFAIRQMAAPGDQPDKILPVNIDPPQKDPFNLQAVKRFVFNETGNIMISTTAATDGVLNKDVMVLFAEVSVFFAAMTRAMSTSINPQTQKPYSIYDYQAIDNIIRGSGLFVQVTSEDVNHTMSSWGVEFSKELIESLLGLATGSGALAFASALVSSVGQRGLEISGKSESSESKVGSIVFVCEYLLGVPLVSAIVVYIDVKQNSQVFQAGPCVKEQSSSFVLNMHKDTYFFVTPAFIKKFSGSLLSVETDVDYLMFIDYLRDIVSEKPMITGVSTLKGDPAPTQLVPNETYVMTGVFLSLPDGKRPVLKMLGKDATATVSIAEAQFNTITFTVSGKQATATAIGVFAKAEDAEPYATTPQGYTVA